MAKQIIRNKINPVAAMVEEAQLKEQQAKELALQKKQQKENREQETKSVTSAVERVGEKPKRERKKTKDPELTQPIQCFVSDETYKRIIVAKAITKQSILRMVNDAVIDYLNKNGL